MNNFLLFLPETLMLLTALGIFLCPVLALRQGVAWAISLVGGAATFLAASVSLRWSGEPFFEGIYRVDFFSQLIKCILVLGFLLIAAISSAPGTIRRSAWPEVTMFMALSTAGMMILVSATELLTMYVALELSAYPIYVLAALHRDQRVGSESAAKYMVQGMVASAISIYGISFIYGLSGTLYLDEIAAQLGMLSGRPLFWVALLLALSGFLFKLAAFPFHFWAPDTYQGAPHQVVTFIATASKVAAVALLCRLVALAAEPGNFDYMAFQNVLLWLSVVAMTLGNLAAIAQRDLKRLLGYSAVAHAGYILIGIQTFSHTGFASALFYVIGYFAMSFVAFLVVCEVANDVDRPGLESLSGLYKRSPFLGLGLLIGVFGLTGLPPTVGFIGKWFLFSAALEEGQFTLVLIAAVNSVVAMYYYLRIVRQAYLIEPADQAPLRVRPVVGLAAAVAMVLVVWMGSAPDVFWRAAEAAARNLL